MATGDQNDILGRLKAVLPPWFPSVTPVLDGLLSGPASALAYAWSFLAYARLQTRLATMTDGFIDLFAWDWFGLRFQRNANEADAPFKKRIVSEIFRPRVTRASITRVLTDLTGNAPAIFEPACPQDAKGWGMAWGWGMNGGYGSLQYPNQAFVQAFRQSTAGIPSVAGWGANFGGYGVGAIEWANASQIIGAVTDAQIYAAIDSVAPAGSIIWTKIANGP